MQEPELARRLASVEFFSTLPEAKRRQIAGHIVDRTHRPGRVLTEHGMGGADLHLILHGTADVNVGGQVRATLTEGDSCGEISLMDSAPRSATVVAGKGALTTAALSPLAFAPRLDDLEVAKPLLRVLTTRLRTAEARTLVD